MPRYDLTLSSKIALLDKIKSQPLNTSYRRLAEITGVPKSTIARVLLQESQLRQESVLPEGQAETFKRKREGKDPDVEEALDQWFSIVSAKGVNINGPTLKAKSQELAKKLARKDFKATDGWLSRWKARHNIKFKKRMVERADPTTNVPNSGKLRKVILFYRIFVLMTFTMLMKPASIIVLRQTVPYAINTLHCLVIKKRWTALLCYAVQICQVLTNERY
ncbi:Tigger transposable element-derived protein 4 [Thelohanellus kitauei]|uniref:Tigger transposable element-derived protein 4 n=1 Tax=Thelohanellus kitauei TaxID=669202 RepID=A0A0C2NHQ2_THEKT|nr:Tigger transposable element-derived protein 4 [Thelohanellus kitauei]